ncbi:MAG TPA: YqgE/AlgH family protein [Acidimicrobiia bacterium]|nr:YqgE/AlgH family protein [Acidimicrobiia bacterium]
MLTAGRLLVASAAMVDPNFEHTVVFMVDHTDDGALGVVLNRPSDTDVDEVLPNWRALVIPPASVFIGGPVQVGDAVIGLARVRSSSDALDGWQPLLGPVGSVDFATDPLDALAHLEGVRVFVGYAGWGPGQLEAELAQGGWLVLDALPDDLLSDAPSTLWRRVLRRQTGEVAMTANQPPDPSVN